MDIKSLKKLAGVTTLMESDDFADWQLDLQKKRYAKNPGEALGDMSAIVYKMPPPHDTAEMPPNYTQYVRNIFQVYLKNKNAFDKDLAQKFQQVTRGIIKDMYPQNEAIVEAPVDGDYILYVDGKEHEVSDDIQKLQQAVEDDVTDEDWKIVDTETQEVVSSKAEGHAGGVDDLPEPEPEDEDLRSQAEIEAERREILKYADAHTWTKILGSDLDQLVQDMEYAIQASFPDGDPTDSIYHVLDKTDLISDEDKRWGDVPFGLIDALNDGFEKRHGMNPSQYYDMMLGDYKADNPDADHLHFLTQSADDEISELKELSGLGTSGMRGMEDGNEPDEEWLISRFEETGDWDAVHKELVDAGYDSSTVEYAIDELTQKELGEDEEVEQMAHNAMKDDPKKKVKDMASQDDDEWEDFDDDKKYEAYQWLKTPLNSRKK